MKYIKFRHLFSGCYSKFYSFLTVNTDFFFFFTIQSPHQTSNIAAFTSTNQLGPALKSSLFMEDFAAEEAAMPSLIDQLMLFNCVSFTSNCQRALRKTDSRLPFKGSKERWEDTFYQIMQIIMQPYSICFNLTPTSDREIMQVITLSSPLFAISSL